MKSMWDRPTPPPAEVECPKCHQTVATETVRGRVRLVTTTVVHIASGRVCHTILNTKETR